MASLSAYCLCVAVVLGLCSAAVRPSGGVPCPAPCRCQNSTISCRGCPTSYVTISKNVERLYVEGCKDIQYLLRLHQRHDEHADDAKLALTELEIRDSYVRQPESFMYGDYDIRSLILTNNSIFKVNSDTKNSNLTLLDLSHNVIDHIDNRTFVHMKKLLYLDLSANSIVSMGIQCFEGLVKLIHLDLSRNNLTHLNDTVFLPLSSLQQLNLSMNRLEILSERSFSSLLLLQQLDISYNRLTSVAPGTLQFLPNLARLLLADNPQLRPDAQIFVGTGRRLQQVDASRTGLSQVPEALTHSVRYLTLAGNRIASVRCGDLDSYPLLHMLDFADNIIVDIEDDALGRLEMLSQLHLNRNKLETVPKMLPDKLQYLSLDTNLIGNLTITDFATLSGLKVLILSNNAISFIQENSFNQMISLEVLDLSNNPLKVLTPNTFSGPVSLKDLRIACVNVSPPAKDISFPVPSPEGIENLRLERSPGLTRQLMADTAALAAMTRLQHLDIRFSNITTLRSDLLHFLPELKTLKLEGNHLDCSDLGWLGDWMKDAHNDYDLVKCSTPPNLAGKLVRDLEQSINVQTTSLSPAEIPNANVSAAKERQQIQNSVKVLKIMDQNLVDYVKKQQIDKKMEKSNALLRSKNLVDAHNDTMLNDISNFILQKKNGNSSIVPDDAKSSARSVGGQANASKSKQTIGSEGGENKVGGTTKSSVEFSTKKIDGRSKLLQIFSEWSQEPYNRRFDTNVGQKAHPIVEESVSPCSVSGNSNGTENKTKCSQRPGAAPIQVDKNININSERFMYRKIGNDINSSLASSGEGAEYLNATMPTENFDLPKELVKMGNGNSTGDVYNMSTMEVHEGENASEYQTSRFSAEAGSGTGGLGILAVAGAATAAGAALAAAWAARRRPRPRSQDLMEVPTIAAVGELW